MTANTKRLQLVLTPTDLRLLRTMAKLHCCSMSALVKGLIRVAAVQVVKESK